MQALIVSSFRAARSLFVPGMFVLFLWSIMATIAALAGFVTGAGFFFGWLADHLQAGYVRWVGTLGAGVIAWFLFPGIMPVIVNFFDERIANIIERHDYPGEPVVIRNFWRELLHDAKFSVLVVLLNLAVLPLYLLPVVNLFLFYGLNGYLLGREFFMMAAQRHMTIADADALRQQHSRAVTMAGVLLTIFATIPIVNLFAPFWGIAVMVHLYHKFASANI